MLSNNIPSDKIQTTINFSVDLQKLQKDEKLWPPLD